MTPAATDGLRARPSWVRALVVFGVVGAVFGAFGLIGTVVGGLSTAAWRLPSFALSWPSVITACQGSVRVALIDDAPPAEPTGLQVRVGLDLTAVDLDTGQVDLVPPSADLGEEHVSQSVQIGEETLVMLQKCYDGDLGTRLARLTPTGPEDLSTQGQYWGIVPAADSAFAFGPASTIDTGSPTEALTVTALPGGAEVTMPAGFFPYGAWKGRLGGLVRKILPGPDENQFQFEVSPFDVILVDAATGKTVQKIGAAAGPVIGSRGHLSWVSGCTPGQVCTFHTFDLAARTGSSGDCQLPTGMELSRLVALSPDGQQVALTMQRPEPDPVYRVSGEAVISLVSVDLKTCRADVVPGLRLTNSTPVTVEYAPDGQRLVLAVPTEQAVEVLTWEPGRPTMSRAASLPGEPVDFVIPLLVDG